MKIRALGFSLAAGTAAFWLLAAASEDVKPSRMYTVGGTRHGLSFFPRVDYEATRPRVRGQLDFAHYHRYDEVLEILRMWEKDYPELVTLYSVGKSFEGREIWQVTITNKATGPDTDKPAFFIEGNRHSGEVTAAESALYFAWRVLGGYGREPDITRLVDGSALYVKIKNNPDGAELYLGTAQSNRSTVRPHDDDGDGLLDEDPPEDLDGDGFIFQMRQKVEDGKGEFVVNPEDPSGRLMKRAGRGKGNYKIHSEGVDNDGDGRFNEDGIGGLDLHRNYPENWRPEPGLDRTGRGWTQEGAGEFPLSETETRAVVLFLLEHPNISIAQTMDTSVPMLLRPPSTSRGEESMIPEDLALYRHFDREGLKITGYPHAGDVYWDYANAGRDEAAGKAMAAELGSEMPEGPRGEPLFGHSPDFGYFQYGAIWYGDELWNGGRPKDYNGDGRVSDVESLRWLDENLPGKYFKPWTKFAHPQLGEVEIGGFNPKFFRQNPPPEILEEWAAKEANFNLLLARSLPRVRIVSVAARPVRKEPGFYEVVAVAANDGFLPTALEMAKRVKIVRPDAASLRLTGTGAEPARDTRLRQEIGFLKPGERKEIRWKIKAPGLEAAEAEVTLSSTRGGVARQKVKIR